MERKYFIIDLETTANGGPYKTSPEAHWSVNKILLCGWMRPGYPKILTNPTPQVLMGAMEGCIRRGQVPVIVAHNAKFDIKYLMRFSPTSIIWRDVEVWDSMTWEYLHSGHTNKFSGLEETAHRHNIPFSKSLDLGALLKSGLKMEDIPVSDLKSYLTDDVLVLSRIRSAQATLLDGVYPGKNNYDMQYLLPLAEMELNGLEIDQEKMMTLFTVNQQIINTHERVMVDHIVANCQWQDGSSVDPLEDFTEVIGTKTKEIKMFSRRTLSFLLTGVPSQLDITSKWKLRFKVDKAPYWGFSPALHPSYYKGETNLGYEINEKVLDRDPSIIIQWTSKHRKAEKLVSTYLGPMAETVRIQGTVHPKLNTALTATGRLSSSQPNGQNMPGAIRSLVKASPHTHIYEIDFKQLEMIAVACISECKDMIHALNRGDDLHYLSGKSVMGWNHPSDMTNEGRKIVKGVNFGVLYGGKAAGLSHQTGLPHKVVQNLINGFFKEFPGVAAWQKTVFTQVVDAMFPYDIKEGEQRYASQWTLPLTERRFTFVETLAPAWLRKKTHRKWSFAPTQTSNYPVQGCAGGDLVMYALYQLWSLNQSYKFLLTVHDSILIESSDNLEQIQLAVKDMCARTTKRFNLPVSLACDVEKGDHWK